MPTWLSKKALKRLCSAHLNICENISTHHLGARFVGLIKLKSHTCGKFFPTLRARHAPAALNFNQPCLNFERQMFTIGINTQHDLSCLARTRQSRRHGAIEAHVRKCSTAGFRLLTPKRRQRNLIGVPRLAHLAREIVHMPMSHEIDAASSGRSWKCAHGLKPRHMISGTQSQRLKNPSRSALRRYVVRNWQAVLAPPALCD